MMINLEQIMGTVQLLLHNQSPAHDFQHILRVYKNAEMISKQEKSVDLDVVLAAALLHDLVVYPKKVPKQVIQQMRALKLPRKYYVSTRITQ